MTAKLGKIFLVLVFLSTITLPLVFSDKAGGQISEAENRYLAKFPVILTDEKTLAPGIKTGLENWISDNAGGRDLAATVNKTFTYKVFHVVPEKNVIEGKDDWLYLIIPDFDLPEFVNTNIPTQEQLDWLKINFSKISSDLKEDNIEYLVFLLPYKVNIYPEYIPDSLVQVNEVSALKVMDENLSGNPNFNFSTALDELLAGKNNRPVYYKAYDRSHWNQHGAFLGYTALMEQAKKLLPNLRILTESDFVITSATLDTSTSWGFYTQEEDLQYSLANGYQAISDKTFFTTFEFTSKDQWNSYNFYKNPDSSLPKAVIVGDSFIWMFLLPNMSESFSELAFIHYSDMENLNKIIKKINPDILIASGLSVEVYTFASYIYDAPKNYAQIVSTSTPTKIKNGEKLNVEIVVKNTGGESWTENKGIRLGIFVNGADHGFRVSLPNDVVIKPGEEYTFTLYDFQAPSDADFSLQYQMLEEGIEYFGEKFQVNVLMLANQTDPALAYGPLNNPTAKIVFHTTPTQVERNGKYEIQITVKNTSQESWSGDRGVSLSIFQDGQDSYRVFLPDGLTIQPGDEYTFTFTDFQAPPTGNSTYLEYLLVEEGVQCFGDKVRVDIIVN